ncbi:LysR family transcriptional regulator [Algivirga pacifica]|uniref:Selenium metabolism-associated LysR family transcriptional regulator n=1 Tax=Algivirga pacifica TaxID=1162670 RepID=A0ABP9DIX3_9BACT
MKTKIQIFQIVAKHLSFTKAAEQLYLSQPAISKAIKTLEQEFNTTLFIRKRNGIELTDEGKSFLVYVDKLLAVYAEMEEAFTHKKETFPELIKLGVSTTLSNYIIPKVIAKFNQQFPKTRFHIIDGNTEEIQELILSGDIDLAITEGSSSNPKLNFKKFIKDEIVLVTNAHNNSFKNEVIDLEKLQEIPIISREQGSGTKEIIDAFLSEYGISKLNVLISFNSTEAIKNYLYHSDQFALVSIHAITDDLNTNKLKVIDIKNLSIERWFYFVRRTGYLSNTTDYLEKFIRTNYNF